MKDTKTVPTVIQSKVDERAIAPETDRARQTLPMLAPRNVVTADIGPEDRRSGYDRREGKDRRGQFRPQWTLLPDPSRVVEARPYHFRSFINRREIADRRSVPERCEGNQRLDPSRIELSAEEVAILLDKPED